MKTKLKGIERASRILLAVLAGFIIWGTAVNTEIFQVEAKLPVRLTANGNLVILSMSADSVRFGMGNAFLPAQGDPVLSGC